MFRGLLFLFCLLIFSTPVAAQEPVDGFFRSDYVTSTMLSSDKKADDEPGALSSTRNVDVPLNMRRSARRSGRAANNEFSRHESHSSEATEVKAKSEWDATSGD